MSSLIRNPCVCISLPLSVPLFGGTAPYLSSWFSSRLLDWVFTHYVVALIATAVVATRKETKGIRWPPTQNGPSPSSTACSRWPAKTQMKTWITVRPSKRQRTGEGYSSAPPGIAAPNIPTAATGCQSLLAHCGRRHPPNDGCDRTRCAGKIGPQPRLRADLRTKSSGDDDLCDCAGAGVEQTIEVAIFERSDPSRNSAKGKPCRSHRSQSR